MKKYFNCAEWFEKFFMETRLPAYDTPRCPVSLQDVKKTGQRIDLA
jgi:hypothetical protein